MIGIIVAAIVLAGILFFALSPEQNIKSESDKLDDRIGQTYQVSITDTGFTPKTFTIKKGDSVTWTNARSAESWPASAQHPSHTLYPGSGIDKCGTSDENTIFDACDGLAQNESYTFTFNEVGSWNYHDHLVPSQSGRIVVEP